SKKQGRRETPAGKPADETPHGCMPEEARRLARGKRPEPLLFACLTGKSTFWTAPIRSISSIKENNRDRPGCQGFIEKLDKPSRRPQSARRRSRLRMDWKRGPFCDIPLH